MTSWPTSGSGSRPGLRRGLIPAMLIALLSLALHIDCAVAGAEPAAFGAVAAPAVAGPVHPGVHMPEWDHCCGHDRFLVQASVLPGDPAKDWPVGLLCWVLLVLVLAHRFPAATAVRGPPGSPPFTRTGRQILTHLGISRR